MIRALLALLMLTACGTPMADDPPKPKPPSAGPPKPMCPCCHGVPERVGYAHHLDAYKVPDVTLIDQHGRRQPLQKLLTCDARPVLLTFSFTSCTTVCPVLNATFSSVQKSLANKSVPVRLVTISIDPRRDTPAQLLKYSRSFEAAENWSFLTGPESDVARVRKAFDAFTANKSRHAPLVFIRAPRDSQWTRLDGLMGSQQLEAELLAAISSATQERENAVESGKPASSAAGTTNESRSSAE